MKTRVKASAAHFRASRLGKLFRLTAGERATPGHALPASKPRPVSQLRAIFYAVSGFSLWVFADSCMKLAGDANLPVYETVGFMGLFGAASIFGWSACRGSLHRLKPRRILPQIGRALLVFGCVLANAVTLKHVPLTLFYIIVFTSPLVIVIMAGFLLKEKLSRGMLAALAAGFAGVVIALNPWGVTAGGDWTGYIAGGFSVLFFAAASVLTRALTQSETPQSTVLVTGLTECVLGLGGMAWHAVPPNQSLLLLLAAMGALNIMGNLCNSLALRATAAATVEQFHYTQIVIGAAIGYIVWHEIPTRFMLAGAVLIMGAGLYVAAALHKAERKAAFEI